MSVLYVLEVDSIGYGKLECIRVYMSILLISGPNETLDF